LKDCPGDIELIQTWPGGGNSESQTKEIPSSSKLTDSSIVTSQKVPTLCSYDDERMKWGHQTDQSSQPGTQNRLIQGVKLLLDESQKFRYAPAIESQGIIKDLKKTAVEVAGDDLEKLVVHAREVLTRRFGTALRAMDLEYILTVPAVWSDKGKDLTMQAAHRAGISSDSLRLLSEPEAAAVCAIRTIQPNSITV
jgi:molecular chaperone DnaK (HSP70)